MREADEVFIYMHRNFRASRNIRAHWFFHHLDKPVKIADDTNSEGEDDYSTELVVAGIVAKGGQPTDCVLGEQFLVTVNTKITYISRYYRHVYVLDLSPSTIVADDESDCCLCVRLISNLRRTIKSSLKPFIIPGTRRLFEPQIFLSVIVFVPFLNFEHDLTLVQGKLLTNSNVESVLEMIEKKFEAIFAQLYRFSQSILSEWGKLKRRYKNYKFESCCEPQSFCDETFTDESPPRYDKELKMKYSSARRQLNLNATPHVGKRTQDLMQFQRGYWKTSPKPIVTPTQYTNETGYVLPEWSLIFMLRIGLIATQMLPENTQSNLILITDAVCGMPDANALQQVLTQLRSYTVSCSFIQLQRDAGSEPVFGHVGSCELLHFMAMATFGTYLCDGEDEEDEEGREENGLNEQHRALICWSFQNALAARETDELESGIQRHHWFKTMYRTTLNQLLYVRLREGFTLKTAEFAEDKATLHVVLCLVFRPLVFIDYEITSPWPKDDEKQDVHVDIVIQAPYNELKDLLTQGQYLDPERMNLTKTAIDGIIEADRLLLHIHKFDSRKHYYTIPAGVTIDYALFDSYAKKARKLPAICIGRHDETSTKSFIGFWSALLDLHDTTWQKWVHTHSERVLLTVPDLPFEVFNTSACFQMDCTETLNKLHAFVKSKSSFCLVNEHTYVTLVHRQESAPPAFFYLTRICNQPPTIVIKTAFLGGMSSSVRKEIVKENRKQLLELRFGEGSLGPRRDNDRCNVLSVIRRPLERMLVRYNEVPADLRKIVRIDESPSDEEEIKLITLHNAIAKCLSCRRCIILMSPHNKEGGAYSVRHLTDYIMNVIMRRRLIDEKFKPAWTRNNIVSLCRQVYEFDGNSLEQFIMFPATPLVGTEKKPLMRRVGRRKAGSQPNVMPSKRMSRALAIICEFWFEPRSGDAEMAAEGDAVDRRIEDDVYLASVIYTIDRIIRLCGSCVDPKTAEETNGWTLNESDEDEEKQFDADAECRRINPSKLNRALNGEAESSATGASRQRVSPFVSVFSNLFSLTNLLRHAPRSHATLKHFMKNEADMHTCNEMILTTLHAQLTAFADVTWNLMEADNRVIRETLEKETGKEWKNLGLQCYVKGLTPWMIGLIFVPTAKHEELMDAVPLLMFTCNETQLAYGAAHRGHAAEPSSMGAEWISSTRFGWRPNNQSHVLDEVSTFEAFAAHVEEELLARTQMSAVFEAARAGMPVDEDKVAEMTLDMEFDELELENVPLALRTLCAHLGGDAKDSRVCSGESSINDMFDAIVSQDFGTVPGTENMFFVKSKKGRSIPLFLQLQCSVMFAGFMTSFAINYLPSCIYQLLEKVDAPWPQEVKEIEVRLELVVMSNRRRKCDDDIKGTCKSLPRKEKKLVIDLMENVNIVLDLERILIESRAEKVTEETIHDVCTYVERATKASMKIGCSEMKEKPLTFVVNKAEAKAKFLEMMDGRRVEYARMRRLAAGEKNLFYARAVEDQALFEENLKKVDICHKGENDRKDVVNDFWLILKVDESEVEFYFIQRYPNYHSVLLNTCWMDVRKLLRTINQELLLERMFEHRTCDSLLIPLDEEESKRYSTSTSPIADRVRYEYSIGSFGCPLRAEMWFEVPARLSKAMAFEKMSIAMKQHGVRNVANTYVAKSATHGIMYMQLHSTMESYERSVRLAEIGEKKKRMRDIEHKIGHQIGMTMFAINEIDKDLCERFRLSLQQTIHNMLLQELLNKFALNRNLAIRPSEIGFLQPGEPHSRAFFSIPAIFADYLAPIRHYLHQHVQCVNNLTKAHVKEENSGSSRSASFSTNVSRRDSWAPTSIGFRHHPPLRGDATHYNLSAEEFYFYVKLPSPGVTSVGLGLVEVRMTALDGSVMDTFAQALLNEQSHQLLVPNVPGDKNMVYRDITKVYKMCEPSDDSTGICAYVEMIFWKQGGIETSEIEELFRRAVEMSLHDVITEFGYLNVKLIEWRCATADGAESSMAARRIDSRSSLSRVCSLARDEADFIQKRHVYGMCKWFDFVVSRAHAETTALVKETIKFDCEIVNALIEMRKRIELEIGGHVMLLKKDDGESGAPARGSSCSLMGDHHARYERLLAEPMMMTADVGVDETTPANRNEYLIVSSMRNVFAEIAGGEAVELAPDRVADLVRFFQNHMHGKYEPLINSRAVIPRQRIMIGLMVGEILTIYFYNFHPNILREVQQIIHTIARWHNAKTRLLREIGVQKMGIGHLSEVEQNEYEKLIETDPQRLIAADYPPEAVSTSVGSSSNLLQRMYRQPNLYKIMPKCNMADTNLPMNHFNQMIRWRKALSRKMEAQRSLKMAHDGLLKGNDVMSEEQLGEFMSLWKEPPTCTLPLLLVDEWRRAEETPKEEKKKKRRMRKEETLNLKKECRQPAESQEVLAESVSAFSRARAFTTQLFAKSFRKSARDEAEVETGQDPLESYDEVFEEVQEQHDEKEETEEEMNVKECVGEFLDGIEALLTEYRRLKVPRGDGGRILVKAMHGGIVFIELLVEPPDVLLRVHLYDRSKHATIDYYMVEKMKNLYRVESEELRAEARRVHADTRFDAFCFEWHVGMLLKYVRNETSVMGSAYNVVELIEQLSHRFAGIELESNIELAEMATRPRGFWTDYAREMHGKAGNVKRWRRRDGEHEYVIVEDHGRTVFLVYCRSDGVATEKVPYFIVNGRRRKRRRSSRETVWLEEELREDSVRQVEMGGDSNVELTKVIVEENRRIEKGMKKKEVHLCDSDEELNDLYNMKQMEMGESTQITQTHTPKRYRRRKRRMIRFKCNYGERFERNMRMMYYDGLGCRVNASGSRMYRRMMMQVPYGIMLRQTVSKIRQRVKMERWMEETLQFRLMNEANSFVVNVDDGETSGGANKLTCVEIANVADEENITEDDEESRMKLRFRMPRKRGFKRKKMKTRVERLEMCRGDGTDIFDNYEQDDWEPCRKLAGVGVERVYRLLASNPLVRLDYVQPLLKPMLDEVNCSRLCRYLIAKYGPRVCTFHESEKTREKILIIKNERNHKQAMVVRCRLPITPIVYYVNVEKPVADEQEKIVTMVECLKNFLNTLVTFVWTDMVYRPIGQGSSSSQNNENVYDWSKELEVFKKDPQRISHVLYKKWKKNQMK